MTNTTTTPAPSLASTIDAPSRYAVKAFIAHRWEFFKETVAPFLEEKKQEFTARYRVKTSKENLKEMARACVLWHHRYEEFPLFFVSAYLALTPFSTNEIAGYKDPKVVHFWEDFPASQRLALEAWSTIVYHIEKESGDFVVEELQHFIEEL